MDTLNLKFKKYFIMPLLLCALVCAALFLGPPPAARNSPSADRSYKEWMQNLKGSALLTQIALPGSHDAGSYNMMSLAETQRQSVGVQLSKGVRYFDLRARNKNGVPLIFHGPINGASVEEVLNDVAAFLNETQEEFLVLDFQHFENQAEPLVWELIQTLLKPDVWCVPANVDLGDLSLSTASENGWRYLITWGSVSVPNPEFLMPRTASLVSPYNEEIHKSGADALIEHFPAYFEQADAAKIFVLQSQLTAPNLLTSPVSVEKTLTAKANAFLESLSGELLRKTNVVMRDFILDNENTIPLIVSLNEKKGLWKE